MKRPPRVTPPPRPPAPDAPLAVAIAPQRSARLRRALRKIAEKQEMEVDHVAATMFATYAAEIPVYAEITDPAMREDVESVSAALVRLWLHFMITAEPLSSETAAVLRQGARRRAAQGVDLHSFLRAFRVGTRVMWRELFSTAGWQTAALKGAAVEVAEWTLDFTDQVTNEVVAAYVDEAAVVAREREYRRSALLNVILAGSGGEAVHAPAQLGSPHRVVVAQTSEDLTLERLEEIGVLLESKVGAALWTVRHHCVIAAVPIQQGRDRAGIVEVLSGLLPLGGVRSFGVGAQACDARDSRNSYREAVDALNVGGMLGGREPPVYDYPEFAPLVALLNKPEQATRFVASTLEALGPLADRPWALPTIEAYLACQGRMGEIAQHLGVHISTAKYRINEIRDAVGAPAFARERSASLALALQLRRLLGAGVGRQ